MSGIGKAFPGVVALDHVDFAVEAGEVRALMGENGAGKSTLIKILSGALSSDSGTIVLDGQEIRPRSPVHAQELGISTVFQEVDLAPNLTVAECVCLGRENRRFGLIDRRAMATRTERALERLDLRLDVQRPLASYSTAVQQLVAIARALDRDAKVLVLDEPTSSLDREEVDRLFALIRDLRGHGMGIVFVTHFLDQTYAVSDSITVLRNGSLVGTWPVGELPVDRLVAAMIGRSLEGSRAPRRSSVDSGETMLRVKHLGKRKMLQPIDFDAHRGEVVALSGLLGSGRTETLRLVYGAERPDSGSVEVAGSAKRIGSPREAVRLGLGLCPEDRKAEGICPGLSIRENVLLVLQAKCGWFRPISRRRQDSIVDDLIGRLGIRTPDGEKPIDQLSGGNQQKALLARWLAAQPKLLLLDEPTRGVDIGSRTEIQGLIRQLADDGMGFLVASSELEEVVQIADQVLVLRDRHLVGTLQGDAIEEDAVMELIAGGSGA